MNRPWTFGSLGSTKALSFERWAGVGHDELRFMAQWLIRLVDGGGETRTSMKNGQGPAEWRWIDDMSKKKEGQEGNEVDLLGWM